MLLEERTQVCLATFVQATQVKCHGSTHNQEDHDEDIRYRRCKITTEFSFKYGDDISHSAFYLTLRKHVR